MGVLFLMIVIMPPEEDTAVVADSVKEIWVRFVEVAIIVASYAGFLPGNTRTLLVRIQYVEQWWAGRFRSDFGPSG
jgi:hypothetical protein